MNVLYTPRAFRELKEIYTYLQGHSPRGVASVMGRLEELISALSTQPQIGVRAGARGLRRASAQPYPYLVFYRVKKFGVVIHGIRHAARDPKSMPDAEG